MVREKMPRINRAAQFAPFDALKGLHDAMRMKEYEHDKVQQNEMSEDQIKEISNCLSSIVKGDMVEIDFFRDGHNINLSGKASVNIENQEIKVSDFVISFNEIQKIKKTCR